MSERVSRFQSVRPGVVQGAFPERADDAGPRRSLWGTSSGRGAHAFVRRVNAVREELEGQSDAELAERIGRLRQRLAVAEAPGGDLVEGFGLVREQARRQLGTPHYDVQLLGGYWMAHGRIAELQTGEGKTLAATLPTALAALAGIPVHVVSANDYLVERDAESLAPLYESLGLQVAAVTDSLLDPELRVAAYQSDIVFATTRTLAFDYLRDTIARRRADDEPTRLRGLCFALVDEADSVLIDQANMPLVLAAPVERGPERRMRRRALRLADALEHGRDFGVDPSARSALLSDAGRSRLETLCKPFGSDWAGPRRRERWVEQALQARWVYRKDRDYVVRGEAIELVDPATGRVAPDRTWERGLQQLIEIKEGCPPSTEHETLGRISVQRFYRRYLQLAGTTGTAVEAAAELRSSYGLVTRRMRTRLPECRRDDGTTVHAEARGKWAHVVDRVREVHAAGRPVLVGAGTVASAQHLATLLRGAGVPHRLLSARQDRAEAEIVARAGHPGRVTVATQMAGRGTDIALPAESRSLGGLHVIATEWGDSARVERQLVGRCARQGDPGSFECSYSLDDEAVARHLSASVLRLVRWLATKPVERQAVLAKGWANLLTWLVRSAEDVSRRRQRRELVLFEEELDQMLAFSGRGG